MRLFDRNSRALKPADEGDVFLDEVTPMQAPCHPTFERDGPKRIALDVLGRELGDGNHVEETPPGFARASIFQTNIVFGQCGCGGIGACQVVKLCLLYFLIEFTRLGKTM